MFGSDQSDSSANSTHNATTVVMPDANAMASDAAASTSASVLPGVSAAPVTSTPGAPAITSLDEILKSSEAPVTDDKLAKTREPSSELMALKQKALSALSPLVGQLEQTPEERFKTIMMMIQAADDQTMIAEAYEAATKIEDEKVKAQALLDVVNEINYFTQQA